MHARFVLCVKVIFHLFATINMESMGTFQNSSQSEEKKNNERNEVMNW